MSQNWQYNTPMGVGQPGSTPVPRDEHDAALMQQRSRARVPGADYPAGYLGTVQSRRSGRLGGRGGVRGSLNTKTYQRGVHKATRVDPDDYFWPDDFNPMTGIQLESQGLKFAPTMEVKKILTNDGKPAPRGSESLLEIDPYRVEHLRSLGPSWG